MQFFKNTLHIEWNRIKSMPMEKKKELLPFIKYLIDLAVQCREEGIIPLQNENKEQKNVYLKIACELIIRGTIPEITDHVLENFIHSTEQSDVEYIESVLIYQWAKTVQNGMAIQEIKYIFVSVMGLDFFEEINEK